MIDSRQAFADKLSISRGLVPAHAGYRIISLICRVISDFPRGRPRPASLVSKRRSRLLPRKLAPIVKKFLFPEFRVGIPTGVHESLKFAVGDFEFIYPIVSQINLCMTFETWDLE